MKQKIGVDLSHFNEIEKYNLPIDFAILKATEGASFVDPTYKTRVKVLRSKGIRIGHYHFAELGNVIREAEHFAKTIEYNDGDIVALDFEIEGKDIVNWCYDFLSIVKEELKTKPLIYLNVATIKNHNWQKVINAGYGLWIADYSDGRARTGQWKGYVIRQTTSKGKIKGIKGNVDLDIMHSGEPRDEVLGWIKDNIYNFKNKINEKEAKKIIKRLSALKNEATSHEKIDKLQLANDRLKSSLNGYIKKVKNLQKETDLYIIQNNDLKNNLKKNAKDTKIISALIFFIKSVLKKLT